MIVTTVHCIQKNWKIFQIIDSQTENKNYRPNVNEFIFENIPGEISV